MSIVMQMLAVNEPLCNWRKFKPEGRFTYRAKEDTRKMAQMILKQCSHSEVVELVAKEFNGFPERLRIDFRTLASSENAASGNVRKGLQRLNEKLGGKLLSEKNERVVNTRVESVDGVSYKRKRINESVAGAKRKYGIID